MKSNQRALSQKQAQACEEATQPRCRCRCGGAFHGAKRKGFEEGSSFYEQLPEDDPHHVKPTKPSASMQSYLVTVNASAIRVDDYKPRSTQEPDLVALVDGIRQQYFIKKHRHLEGNSTWGDRGRTHAFYHAKNSGHDVEWLPKSRKLRKSKKKISQKQMALF